MFNAKLSKKARQIHKKAVEEYNQVYDQVQSAGQSLYSKREDSVSLIKGVEDLINTISNRPKGFDTALTSVSVEHDKFKATENFAREAVKSAVHSGARVAAGVAGGAAVASLAPSAAMWVATTFGTASTGTAISTLSGIVAENAALAWLGGGSLAAGGSGIVGGKALLALAGPVGWGIAGASTAASVFFLSRRNKKIAKEAIEEAEKITKAGAGLKETGAKIVHLRQETETLYEKLSQALAGAKDLRGVNYSQLPEDRQMELGTLVNNTLSLAQLLNRTVEED